jgi:hypothetical protein
MNTFNTPARFAAFACLGTTVIALSGAALAGDEYDLAWNTIDGGGGTSVSGDFVLELTGTIGQHDASVTLQGGVFQLAGGFWAGGGVEVSDPVADITAFTLVKGTLLGGGLPEFRASDDTYFHTRSGIGQTFIDLHHMEVHLDLHTDVANPALLDLLFETRINDTVGTSQVRLWNWSTSRFVQVGSFALGSTDQVRQILDVPAAAYVNAQGEMRLVIKHLVFVPQFAYFFQSFLDEVRVTVE